MTKSKRLKNSKLAQLVGKKNGEEISEEKEFEKRDRLDSIMQRIDKFWYGDNKKT